MGATPEKQVAGARPASGVLPALRPALHTHRVVPAVAIHCTRAGYSPLCCSPSPSATGNYATQQNATRSASAAAGNDTSIRGSAFIRIPSSMSNHGLMRIASTAPQRPASAMGNAVKRIPSGYDSAHAPADGQGRQR